MYNVYNLEFPSWCEGILAGGYEFTRVPEYRDRVKALQHLVGNFSEFELSCKSGSHQVTAHVLLPDSENESILFSHNQSFTCLDDLLLLLSIFTKRHVFTLWGHQGEDQLLRRLQTIPPGSMLTADHRQFPRGGITIASIGYDKKPGGTGSHGYYDGSLEKSLNAALSLIRDVNWQKSYGCGQFLVLYREVIAAYRLEIAFSLAWTMWEHLFSVQNGMWLDKNSRVTAKEKILYVAHKILGLDDSPSMRKRFADLVEARNRLVHFGILPEDNSSNGKFYRDAVILFLELTEMVIVRALALGEPSNLFNTIERLEAWLNGRRPQMTSA
jgi:hypothetical protein